MFDLEQIHIPVVNVLSWQKTNMAEKTNTKQHAVRFFYLGKVPLKPQLQAVHCLTLAANIVPWLAIPGRPSMDILDLGKILSRSSKILSEDRAMILPRSARCHVKILSREPCSQEFFL